MQFIRVAVHISADVRVLEFHVCSQAVLGLAMLLAEPRRALGLAPKQRAQVCLHQAAAACC